MAVVHVSRALVSASAVLGLCAAIAAGLAGCGTPADSELNQPSQAEVMLEESADAVRTADSGRFSLDADAIVLDTVIVGAGEGEFAQDGYALSLALQESRGEWHFRGVDGTTYLKAESAEGETGSWQDVGGIFLPVDPRGFLGLVSIGEDPSVVGTETVLGSACTRLTMTVSFDDYVAEMYRSEVPTNALGQMESQSRSPVVDVWVGEERLPCRIKVAEDNGNVWIAEFFDWGAAVTIEEPETG
jgi:hypothetical protein